MTVSLDLRVTELLASRICHDLISPVGAINNGVELLEEMGAQVGEEAVKLIGHSADMASRRLRLFRVAYGSAGAAGSLSCDEVLTTMRDYVSGSRVSLSWDAAKMKNIPGAPAGSAKVLLNMVIIAFEALVHGGSIEVSYADNSNNISILAVGRGAGARDEAWLPLKGEVAVTELSAKSVHPYVTGQFAKHYGLTLSHAQEPDDRLTLGVSFVPAVTPA